MATDKSNLKIARVSQASDAAFGKAVIAAGSIYFKLADKRLTVGDGATAGGITFAKKSELDSANSNVSALTGRVSSAESKISSVESKVSSVDSKYSTAVLYSSQTLTADQKAQVLTNVGAYSTSAVDSKISSVNSSINTLNKSVNALKATATADKAGLVKIGSGISVATDGTISAQKVDLSPYAKTADIAGTYAKTADVASTYAKASDVAKTYAKAADVAGTYATVTDVANTYAKKSEYLPLTGGTVTGDLAVGGALTVTGAAKAASFQATSDMRLKEDLQPVAPDVSRLHCYRYILKTDGQKHVGLLAQEVQKVIPDAVVADEKGYLSLDYNAVVAALVEEVNALRAEVKALKER
jgi:hypothetical protein